MKLPIQITNIKESLKKLINNQGFKVITICTLICISCCLITYKLTMRKIPKIAVIDLAYINQDFITTFSQYDLTNEAAANRVKIYVYRLGALLNEISKNQGVILLQKQAIAGDYLGGLTDITTEIRQAIFSDLGSVEDQKKLADEARKKLEQQYGRPHALNLKTGEVGFPEEINRSGTQDLNNEIELELKKK
mgnify:CR=1 FL=1